MLQFAFPYLPYNPASCQAFSWQGRDVNFLARKK